MISTLPGKPRIIRYEDRSLWSSSRVHRIGCSETSAALGMNPYCTAFKLWATKCELLPPEDLASMREAVLWGSLLERPVMEEFGRRTGRKIVPHDQCDVLIHPQYDFWGATLDGLQYEDSRGPEPGDLQIKTTSHWMADEWEDGNIPLHVQIQIQSELAVTGMEWGSVACLLGGQRLVYRDMQRYDAFIAAMIPHLEKFWECVETKTPPAIDGSEITSRVLLALHPDDSGETTVLPPEAASWDTELRNVKEKIKVLKELEELNKNRLKAAIGDATFGQLPSGEVYSLKTQAATSFHVNKKSHRVLLRKG